MVTPINIVLFLNLFWWSRICVYIGIFVGSIVIFIFFFF